MRKLIVSEFVSLDGVMQAPGGPDEDRDGGFEQGNGKRALPAGVHTTFTLKSAVPYPSGVVGLHYVRRPAAD